MRGLQVALVEKEDFASGTSSRSSRLVHGGIRYLEHGQLGMVRESVRERETLLRIAPHLVRPLEFTWPVYRGARIGRMKLRAALAAYNLLARNWRVVQRIHSPAQIAMREPLLLQDAMLGGATYTDAATDDSRLTLANVISAQLLGATTLNYAEALRPVSRDKNDWIVDVRDSIEGTEVEVRTSVLVNATGPWHLNLERRWPQHKAQRRGSKGAHIALPRERVGNNGALTLMSPDDGRVMFVLPGGLHTIVGTTDTWTEETPEEVAASPDDVQYLLRAVNAYFPDAKVDESDVVAAWAGIRPLADRDTDKSPSSVSREHRIVRNGAGMITVSGGKLTTYRAMAAEIVDQVEHELGRKPKRSATGETELPGKDRKEHVAALIAKDPTLGRIVVEGLPYTVADLRYGATNEMALSLSDLLMRRTRIAFETPDHGMSVASDVVNAVARSALWDEHAKRAQVDLYAGDVARVFGISSRFSPRGSSSAR